MTRPSSQGKVTKILIYLGLQFGEWGFDGVIELNRCNELIDTKLKPVS